MAKVKKTPRSKEYSEADVSKCLREIHLGMAVRKACFRNRVPRPTINFRLGKMKGKTCKEQGRTGPPSALTDEDESVLVKWSKKMARKGFPVTRYRVLSRVTSFIKKHPEKGNFKTGKPSRAWFKSFMKRHKDLAIRTPESVTNASANVVEPDIRKWFLEVEDILAEEGLVEILRNAKCVLNGDETSFYLDPSGDKVIACRGEKNVYKVDQGPAKKNITVMFTCSADGKMYAPMVVYPYKKIPIEVARSVQADWGIGKTDSGWMTSPCFLKYIVEILHPQLVEADALPAVYFIDGHSSHTAWETADECRKLSIHLVCLYPNCTRILQPLDVAVFKPLKTSWLRVVDDWKLAHPNKYLKTENFAPLLVKAMDAINPTVITNGFKCCGLFPFDANNVDYTKCLGRNRLIPQQEGLPQPEQGLAQSEEGPPHPEEGSPEPEEDLLQSEEAGMNCVRRLPLPGVADAVIADNVETFSVVRSKAEEILQLMGRDRQERYRTREIDDYESLDEIILARVFKLLEPLNCALGHQEQPTPEDVDQAMDIADPTEEILAEYVIDQPGCDFELSYGLDIDPAEPGDEIALIAESQATSQKDHDPLENNVSEPNDDCQHHRSLLSEFLESPETPHRKGTKKYKWKSPAVLTSRRRLMYYQAVHEEKKREAEEKQTKAEEKRKKAEEKRKNTEEKRRKAEERKKNQALTFENKKTGKSNKAKNKEGKEKEHKAE